MAISRFEDDYMWLITNIFRNGYLTPMEAHDVNTKRLSNQTLSIDLTEGFPIVKGRGFDWETYTTSLFHTTELVADGRIGKIIDILSKDPTSLRATIAKYEDKMDTTYTWSITDGKLNLAVLIRKTEMVVDALGDVFDCALLTHIIARCLGITPGNMTILWSTAMILEDDVEYVEKWFEQYRNLLATGMLSTEEGKAEVEAAIQENGPMAEVAKTMKDSLGDDPSYAEAVYTSTPTLWINPEKTKLEDITLEDIRIENYRHMGTIED